MTDQSLNSLLGINPDKEIIIYSRSWCGYCQAAKNVLDQLGLGFEEIDVEKVEGALEEMLSRANGRRTVPQIFINGVGIGGYTELMGLIQQAAQQQQ